MFKHLGYPISSSEKSEVFANQPNRGGAEKAFGESDLFIVLGDGSAVHMGKGQAGQSGFNRKH